MGINKVQYGNTTLIDLTNDTVTADKLMQGYTAHDRSGALIIGTATGGAEQGNVWQDANGYLHLDDESGISLQTKSVTPTESTQTVTPDSGYYALEEVNVGAISSSYVGSGITRRSSSDMTVSGATVTAPSGYYASNASKAVSSGSATTPATTVTANPSISVNSSGLITATASATKSVTPTVSAGYVSSGTAGTITVSGSNTSQLSTQAGKTVTPTESEQTAVASGKYTTGAVKVGAISSTYVGSGITQRDSDDLTISGATVTAPSGYYSASASKSVASGSAGTPTATKGTVSNHSVTVTPSVTNTTGYITGSTKTGTAVTVSASELVSGSLPITANGNNIDVTNYASVNVSVSGGGGGLVYETGIWTPTADIARGTISFANTHTKAPFYFTVVDANDDYEGEAYSMHLVTYLNFEDFSGVPDYTTETTLTYGRVYYSVRSNATTISNSGVILINYPSTNTSATNTNYPRYWATESAIYPYGNNSSRLWRADRDYKWIAVWPPTT